MSVLRRRLSRLANRLFPHLLSRTRLQRRALRYWQAAATTYLAEPEYYARKEAVLRAQLDALPSVASGLDVGCGDGYFSRLLATRVRQLTAADLSPTLIAQAKVGASSCGVENVRFVAASLDAFSGASFDLVAAMGVTSCLVDDASFDEFVSRAEVVTEERAGLVLLIDTLATRSDCVRAYGNGYVARYRLRRTYLDSWGAAGFVLLRDVLIHDWRDHRENRLMLLRRG